MKHWPALLTTIVAMFAVITATLTMTPVTAVAPEDSLSIQAIEAACRARLATSPPAQARLRTWLRDCASAMAQPTALPSSPPPSSTMLPSTQPPTSTAPTSTVPPTSPTTTRLAIPRQHWGPTRLATDQHQDHGPRRHHGGDRGPGHPVEQREHQRPRGQRHHPPGGDHRRWDLDRV